MRTILLLGAVAVATTEVKGKSEQTDNGNISGARLKRQVLRDSGNRSVIWKDGVFYTFNTTDNRTRELFRRGRTVWSENTCIDFIENRTAKDKVIVRQTEMCSSKIGRVGGDQFLCIGDAPDSTVVHEIGHLLGLFHTMSRHDRDQFVEIKYENIMKNSVIDFEIIGANRADVFGLGYDYGSVMHYRENGFSINGSNTIEAKERRYQKTMGSPLISFSDLFMINKRYGCDAKCNKSTSAKCMNGGFPHPRNCSICICPSGYGGALCDKRPPGCGEYLEATRAKKTLTHRTFYDFGMRDRFVLCHFMITAPHRKKIEVELQSISRGYDIPGCMKGGVEIKAQMDQKLTGYRFCSTNGSNGTIVSSTNPLPIIAFNRFTYLDITLKYRYIN